MTHSRHAGRSWAGFRHFVPLVLFVLLLGITASAAPALYRVPYATPDDLVPLLAAGARLRHLSQGWALVEAEPTRTSPPRGERLTTMEPGLDYGWARGPLPPGTRVLLRTKSAMLVAGKGLRNALGSHRFAPIGDVAVDALTPPRSAPVALGTAELNAAATIAEGFDPGRWFALVESLAENFGTRSRFTFRVREVEIFDGSPPPDDALDQAADALLDRFRAYGYIVAEDPFRHTRFANLSEKEAVYGMRNLVATKPGRGPNRNRLLLVTAHYDSVASRSEGWEEKWRTMAAPGANDNASGVATVLETARLLADVDLDVTVRFVLFAGEEIGLFGSRHYAEEARAEDRDIVAVLNVDMLGWDGDGRFDLHVVANDGSEWLLRAIERIAAVLRPGVDLVPIRDSERVFSDHAPFWDQGYSAVQLSEESDFEAPEWDPLYHTVKDTPDHLRLDYAAEAGRFVVALTAALAGPMRPNAPRSTEPVALIRPVLFPNPFVPMSDTPTRIHYQLNRDADIRVEVYDLAGRRLLRRDFPAGGPNGRLGRNAPIVWDGRNAEGSRVAAGLYFVRLLATDAEGETSESISRLLVVPDSFRVARTEHSLSPNP